MDTVAPSDPDRIARAEDTLRRLRARLAHTRTPEHRAELRRQAKLIRGTPEDVEALDFIEAIMDTEGWDPLPPKE